MTPHQIVIHLSSNEHRVTFQLISPKSKLVVLKVRKFGFSFRVSLRFSNSLCDYRAVSASIIGTRFHHKRVDLCLEDSTMYTTVMFPENFLFKYMVIVEIRKIFV